MGPESTQERAEVFRFGDLRGLTYELAKEKGWLRNPDGPPWDPRPTVIVDTPPRAIRIAEGCGNDPRKPKKGPSRPWPYAQARRLVAITEGVDGHSKDTWYWLTKKRIHWLRDADFHRLEPWRPPQLSSKSRTAFRRAIADLPWAGRQRDLERDEN